MEIDAYYSKIPSVVHNYFNVQLLQRDTRILLPFVLSTINIWRWLAIVLNMTIQFNSMDDVWFVSDRGFSRQRNMLIQAAVDNYRVIICVFYFT